MVMVVYIVHIIHHMKEVVKKLESHRKVTFLFYNKFIFYITNIWIFY